MTRFRLLFTFILMSASLFAAATHNRDVTATKLAAQIQGKGITITKPVITRGQIGGANSQVATFSNGIAGANLQIDKGILLTASTADQAFLPNSSNKISLLRGSFGDANHTVNNAINLPTFDSDLMSTISQNKIENQVVFEFDVTLDANTRLLLVDYQFASDEYPEWVGSQFNDAFGFFISGGDLTKTYNIARVVDNSTVVSTANIDSYPPVNINNVNRGSVGSQSSGQPTDLTNSAFFIDNGGIDNTNSAINSNNAKITSEFDGFTTKLHATLDNLTPGKTYHFKMALADTSDAQWDAGVFVNKIIGVREPSLCYDYDVRIGSNINLSTNDNRRIQTDTFPGEELNLGIVLRSFEGEIILEDANMTVIFNPNSQLRFQSAQLSPDSVNAYQPIPNNLVNKIPYAQIPVGENINSAGGTISQNQVIFSNLKYDVNGSGQINTTFDLNATMKLTLNGISVPRSVSTLNGSLPRCPQETGYHPEWASFNIERENSKGLPNEKPILYTQISNRPFNVAVVSYDPNSTNLSTEKVMNDLAMEVELIDAGKYASSEHSLFTCREPASINPGKFATFDSSGKTRAIVQNIQTTQALKNAAFRLWYLKDGNNTLVKYTCGDEGEDYDSTCFETLYNDRFYNKIDKSPYKCDSACSGSTGQEGSNTCYLCLKTYFASPICSRDNFAIRPESFRITISDNNNSSSSSAPKVKIATNNKTNTVSLAAEYNYVIDANATQWNSDNNVKGYYAQYDNKSAPALTSSFLFNTNSGTSCADTNNSSLDVIFRNGIIRYIAKNSIVNANNANQFTHNNTGNYDYHIEDTNWTLVDQASYADKTFPNINDCWIDPSKLYSTSDDPNLKSGCGISSNHSKKLKGRTFVDLSLRFEPYKFGLQGIQFTRKPNKNILFMNDFNQTGYYGSVLSSKLSMSTSFEGNISAEGKNGTVLSNFTDGCTASDVTLSLLRTMNPAENVLTNVPFQQYLEVGLNVVDKKEGNSTTLTLPKSAFKDIDKGNAPMKLHTTLKKPYGFGNKVNPIQVNYKELNATDSTASSFANMGTHIPDGNLTVDQNTTYVYGKVTPLNRLYNNVETSSIKTPLYVDIFCNDNNSTLNAGDCANLFNLNQNSLGTQEKESGWKLATIFTNNELGTTDLTVSHLAEKDALPSLSVDGGATKKIYTAVVFNDNQATQNDINVSVATAARNSMVKVKFDPVPWLVYDRKEDYYRVHFIGPSAWAGVGKTGHVTDTGSSKTQNNRMSW
jgi:hypothetical protein